MKIVEIIFFLLSSVWTEELSRFIKHFEPLQYDPITVEHQHALVRKSHHLGRYRRSASDARDTPTVELTFEAHSRQFELILHADSSVFTDDYEVEDSRGHTLIHRIDHLVSGRLKNEAGSHAEGHIKNGVFVGSIYSPRWGSFYVEKGQETGGVTHSVIYHEKDIVLPNGAPTCKEMKHKFKPVNETFEHFHKPMSDYFETPEEIKVQERLRRETNDNDDVDVEQRNTCIMLIHVDHMFTQQFKKCKNGRANPNCPVDREEVLAFISSHIKAINNIYINRPFMLTENGRKLQLRPRFQVKRVKIDEGTDETDPFRSRNIGVEKFLEHASLNDFNDYCLAYVFTRRDFENGVLGLAWVAQPEGSSGGICEKHKKYNDGKRKSLNTGIITIENYGSVVPPKVSHITFAHEVGHNFGSPHDGGIKCTPGHSSDPDKKRNGNFIMYARATSGDKTNNDQFSPCSINNITRVLEKKRDCFKRSDAPICGNQIVDDGEECDCGFQEDCDKLNDECCYPADTEDKTLRCKRKPQVQCSPSEGPCCDGSTCKFRPVSIECSQDVDCTEAQNCNGVSPLCPKPVSKDDYRWCHKETMTCISGDCSGSACSRFSGILEPCNCIVDMELATDEEKKKHCHVCCQAVGAPETCKSTGELMAYFNSTGSNRTIFRQPGSPCDDYKGYCDVFSKCRSVDADGPLARLKKALFNPVLYSNIKEWIVEYWWAVLLMALALIMLMGAFVKICSLHTPSNNPNMPKHKEFPGLAVILSKIKIPFGGGTFIRPGRPIEMILSPLAQVTGIGLSPSRTVPNSPKKILPIHRPLKSAGIKTVTNTDTMSNRESTAGDAHNDSASDVWSSPKSKTKTLRTKSTEQPTIKRRANEFLQSGISTEWKTRPTSDPLRKYPKERIYPKENIKNFVREHVRELPGCCAVAPSPESTMSPFEADLITKKNSKDTLFKSDAGSSKPSDSGLDWIKNSNPVPTSGST